MESFLMFYYYQHERLHMKSRNKTESSLSQIFHENKEVVIHLLATSKVGTVPQLGGKRLEKVLC